MSEKEAATEFEQAIRKAKIAYVAQKRDIMIAAKGQCPHYRGHFDIASFVAGLYFGFMSCLALMAALWHFR